MLQSRRDASPRPVVHSVGVGRLYRALSERPRRSTAPLRHYLERVCPTLLDADRSREERVALLEWIEPR